MLAVMDLFVTVNDREVVKGILEGFLGPGGMENVGATINARFPGLMVEKPGLEGGMTEAIRMITEAVLALAQEFASQSESNLVGDAILQVESELTNSAASPQGL